MISSIASVSGYGYTQIPAAALGTAAARTPETAAEAETLSNVLPRNLPFLATRVTFDSDINRFVLQFRNSKDGEVTGQIPAGKSSWAYREAQRLREKSEQADAQRTGAQRGVETDESGATTGGGKAAPAPVTIGATGGSASEDTVVTIGGGFGSSPPAPAAVSSYSPPAPATQSSGRGTTA